MGNRSKQINTGIGTRIREFRKSLNLTQEQLGAIVNKGGSTVRMWELGKSEPDAETLTLLSTYFRVSSDTLLGIEKSPSERKGKWINVYGNIAAGIPIEAIEDIIDQEEISADMAAHGEYIALRVKGSSMEPRIVDGDVVIIRLQEEVENGEIAAVFVNGNDVTLKQVKRENNGLWLVPFNAAYQPMFFSEKECAELPVRILGKMVELRAKF